MKKISSPLFLLAVFISINLYAFEAKQGRYFLEGNGSFSIANKKTGKTVEAHYRNEDGSYDEKTIRNLDVLFGLDPKLGEDISLRLISMIDYLEDRFIPEKTLSLISGYRSPTYNAGLRRKGKLAGETSYHMDGMAADLLFPGVKNETIWEYVRSLNCCGIGIYSEGESLHLDSGKPRFWTAGTALPKTKEPPQNRNIYLSVDNDIYHPGETMRLFFSGISQYPFGVKPVFNLMRNGKKISDFQPTFETSSTSADNCQIISKRREARFITWTIPADIKPRDDLSVQVTFCEPVTPKMPHQILSRPFEIR